MVTRAATLLLTLIALLASCSHDEKAGITEVLEKRQRAFEARDVELYSTLISPDYDDVKDGRRMGRKEVIDNFKGILQFFDDIKITYSGRTIYHKGSDAQVVQRARVEVRMEKEGINTSFTMKEVLELKKQGNRWYITKEAERDYAEGFVYGG
jgi:ketosteroid isomerase-like protein